MCSGCSGHYEGDVDSWERPSARNLGRIGGRTFKRNESGLPEAFATEMRRDGLGDTQNRAATREHATESVYEVVVTADEIIERHKICGDITGLL
jgi:hypothetical protein